MEDGSVDSPRVDLVIRSGGECWEFQDKEVISSVDWIVKGLGSFNETREFKPVDSQGR